jgi:hypothetical protein
MAGSDESRQIVIADVVDELRMMIAAAATDDESYQTMLQVVNRVDAEMDDMALQVAIAVEQRDMAVEQNASIYEALEHWHSTRNPVVRSAIDEAQMEILEEAHEAAAETIYTELEYIFTDALNMALRNHSDLGDNSHGAVQKTVDFLLFYMQNGCSREAAQALRWLVEAVEEHE